MKFIYFGDKHERATSPENRVGDFREDVRLKTREIVELGKEHKIQAFLQPGDFWDNPNPSLDYASDVIKDWTDIDVSDNNENLKGSIPIIGVVGNHELFGNNINTLSKTMAGFTNKLGFMQFATKENPIFFTTEDGLKVAITGTHYHLDIDSPEHLDDYIVEEKLGDIHIHIVHGMLSDKNMGKYIRHTLIDEIKHTKADLTLTGHDHIGFPITAIDGKYFANSGAIVRLSNNVKEINRKPKVLLIEITKEKGLVLEEIYLQSAKAGEKVLSRDKIEKKKANEVKMEELKKVVKNADVKKSVNISEIVRDLSDAKGLDDNIKNSVVKRLSDQIEKLSPEVAEADEKTIIKKVILENFQSHSYTELDMDKGFNILVGESKQGKSAVLRALNLVYENKPRGKRYIKQGADYARVIVELSNGYIIERYVEAKASGKNGYFITDPTTGEAEFHNTKILPEVQKILGYNNLFIDKDIEVNLNFLKQGTGWFLIGDHITAPNKAKIIGGIYGTQYADAVIRDLEKDNKQVIEKSKILEGQIEKNKEEAKSMDYLVSVGENIEAVDTLVGEIDILSTRNESIAKLSKDNQELIENIKDNEEKLNSVSKIDQANLLMLEIKSLINKKNTMDKLILKHGEINSKLKNIEISLNAVVDIDKASEELLNITKLHNKINLIKKSQVKTGSLFTELNNQEEILKNTNEITTVHAELKNIFALIEKYNSTKDSVGKITLLTEKKTKVAKALHGINITEENTNKISEAKEFLDHINNLISRKNKITDVVKKNQEIYSKIAKEDEVLANENINIEKNLELYKSGLEQVGKCPTCFGTIDKVTINRIVEEYKGEI